MVASGHLNRPFDVAFVSVKSFRKIGWPNSPGYASTLGSLETQLTQRPYHALQLNPQQLLKETQRAAGGETMVQVHEKLVELNKEVKDIEKVSLTG